MDGSGQIKKTGEMNPDGLTAKTTVSETKKAAEEKKLKKACADFEAFFVYYMLKTMRQSVPKSGFLGNSPGMDSYYMMMDQKIAENVSKKGNGLGLQKMMMDQINRNKIVK